jgi:hypothetical protein
VREFKQALADHNMKVPMATTNLFYDRLSKTVHSLQVIRVSGFML